MTISRRIGVALLPFALFACSAPGGPTVAAQPTPPVMSTVSAMTAMTPAEISYVEQTARVVYRRASVERLSRLLFSDERGHGTCVRSPAGSPDAADYTLLILQRRITEDFISQAADDVLILRSAEEAAPCRRLGAEAGLWITVL